MEPLAWYLITPEEIMKNVKEGKFESIFTK